MTWTGSELDELEAERIRSVLGGRTKRELAARHWKYMQQYADAETEVVKAIMSRANSVTR